MIFNPPFDFLNSYNAPKAFLEAKKLFGVQEVDGKGNSPVIMGWATELGLSDYTNDAIAWCGLFEAIILKRAGYIPPKDFLAARSFLYFGNKIVVNDMKFFDILIFSRPGGGGHVGNVVAVNENNYWVLGGNQANKVSIVEIRKNRLIGVRRPPYKTFTPPALKYVKSGGKISTNEQ